MVSTGALLTLLVLSTTPQIVFNSAIIGDAGRKAHLVDGSSLSLPPSRRTIHAELLEY